MTPKISEETQNVKMVEYKQNYPLLLNENQKLK